MKNMFTLKALGWNDFFEEHFLSYREQGFKAGRIAIENRDNYLVYAEKGELRAEVTGKLMYNAVDASDLPKVGDWVAMSVFDENSNGIIHEILPRRTKFSRKAPGKKTEEQVLASNIDSIFIVQSLDDDFSLPRLERYLVMIHEGGARPVIILNKADLRDDFEEYVEKARRVASGADVLAVSAKTDFGINDFKNLLKQSSTYAFVGSSGVGKTTLINRVLGSDVFATAEVREKDSKGRHTTTRRQLIAIPGGGLLIDTPGMRELQLWSSEEGMVDVYADFNELAEECHFSDCTHTSEIGCAITAAVEDGRIDESRYKSYLKLRKELNYLNEKQSQKGQYNKKKSFKEISKVIKEYKRIDPKRKFK